MKKSIAAIIVSWGIVSCGGGGGNSAPSPQLSEAQGFYKGQTSQGQNFSGVMLDDGTYYALYGKKDIELGVIQGNSTSSNGNFSSSNAKIFDMLFKRAANGTVTGNYVSKQWLNGTIASDANTLSFTSQYDKDYEKKPSLAAIAGNFSGIATSSLPGTIASTLNFTVTAEGNLTGSDEYQCKATGTVSPRAHGYVYDITVKFGGSPCLYANQSLSGIAIYSDSDKAGLAIVLPTDRSSVMMLIFNSEQKKTGPSSLDPLDTLFTPLSF